MGELARERRRDGAVQWGLFEDLEAPGRWSEVFFVPSWADHERQHARVTQADAELQQRIRALHRGPEPPAVSHALSV
jgi:hypothetical protein